MIRSLFYNKKISADENKYTSKISLDPASEAILTKAFHPLRLRVKSPSELLDILGYPATSTTKSVISYSTSTADAIVPTANDRVSKWDGLMSSVRASKKGAIPSTRKPSVLTTQSTLVDNRLKSTDPPINPSIKEEIRLLNEKLMRMAEERDAWKETLNQYALSLDELRKRVDQQRIQLTSLRLTVNDRDYDSDNDDDDDDENEDSLYHSSPYSSCDSLSNYTLTKKISRAELYGYLNNDYYRQWEKGVSAYYDDNIGFLLANYL
ncbi:hypothetical protein BDB01DRAFT_836429 [Pilobolus umbonatus]|nr:hypothetical protein BDB01DRAFT_836429 [Pilobolus umbonatus]